MVQNSNIELRYIIYESLYD